MIADNVSLLLIIQHKLKLVGSKTALAGSKLQLPGIKIDDERQEKPANCSHSIN
jgi:hypothetical protein